jgi:hypothetical protein
MGDGKNVMSIQAANWHWTSSEQVLCYCNFFVMVLRTTTKKLGGDAGRSPAPKKSYALTALFTSAAASLSKMADCTFSPLSLISC